MLGGAEREKNSKSRMRRRRTASGGGPSAVLEFEFLSRMIAAKHSMNGCAGPPAKRLMRSEAAVA